MTAKWDRVGTEVDARNWRDVVVDARNLCDM